MSRYAGLILLAVVMAAAAFYSFWKTPLDSGTVVATRPESRQSQPASSPPAPSPAAPSPTAPTPVVPGSASSGAFDFYVLALSWSPTYCESEGGKGNNQQCGTDRSFGLVVHGLWPQNEKGYPQDCESSEPERVPAELGRRYFDLMPGMGLIGHEWRKHGTCSGLNQVDYFALVRKAYQRIAIPEELKRPQAIKDLSPAAIENQFMKANPGLSNPGISVQCEEEKFEEVRICLTKDLAFRTCAEVDRQSCRRPSLTVPPVR